MSSKVRNKSTNSIPKLPPAIQLRRWSGCQARFGTKLPTSYQDRGRTASNGLLSLRPGLSSASKTAKTATSTAAKQQQHHHTWSSAQRSEKGHDERHALIRSTIVAEKGGHEEKSVVMLDGGKVPPIFRTTTSTLMKPAVRPNNTVHGILGQIVKPHLQRQGNGLTILTQKVGSNYSNSGSEHEINSVCLAQMVHEFMEDEFLEDDDDNEDREGTKCGRVRCNCEINGICEDSSQSVDGDEKSSLGGDLAEILQGLVSGISYSERAILNCVTTIIQEWNDKAEVGSNEKTSRSARLRRHVMTSLRSCGYNAAICKSRWEHAGGFPGGHYEYIDVILGGSGHGKTTASTERIIVDVEFEAQFEIVRPTPQYAALLQLVPAVFAGNADRLQQILNILCDAAKRSLKKMGMPLPPWRKPDYIRAKWFSSYRRITN
ncbi:hypothetical protein R1flu_010361 [Riccia fluitans]|uniref:Uncharacterized protein n=1 Tax=Riccia fluitans TaxID=41844 RepID=A0ABD1Z5V3_9MARC